MMALKPGAAFGEHYEVIRLLSAGGMGIVYEVLHKETKRRRALKVMLPHVLVDPTLRQRFAQEVVVTADIESEHLVEVFDAGIDAETDCPYFVMELLRGEDLGARLRRGERFSVEDVLVFFDQITRTLEKTHAAGIVHRDLKPENLFLTRRDDGSPRIKICDFGIAKVVRSTSADLKATTQAFGTPCYMASEQVTGEAKLIGPSSDLCALGHIAYALLVGSAYFQDEAEATEGSMLSLLLAVAKGPTEMPSERARRRGLLLPEAFDAWFVRATQTDPRKRYQSAGELMVALREALREPIVAAAPDAARVAPASTPVHGSSPPVPLALGGTVPMTISAETPSRARSSSAASDGVPVSSEPSRPDQTASPQSIPTPQTSPAATSSRAGWLLPAIGAAVAVAVAFFLLMSRDPGVASSGDSTAGRQIASGEPPTPVPASSADVTVVPAASSSPAAPTASEVAALASASASATAAPSARSPGRPRAGVGSAAATSAPVWTVR